MISNKFISSLVQFLKTKIEGHQNRDILSEDGKDIKLLMDGLLHTEISNYLKIETGIRVFSEESDNNYNFVEEEGDYWLIDPLDGSLNFSKGNPIWCISIAFISNKTPIVGIIFDFNRDQVFYGAIQTNQFDIDMGAWCNDSTTHVSRIEDMQRAVLATGFPSLRNYEEESLIRFVSEIKSWKKIRLYGSAALSLAWLSIGYVDAYTEEDIRIWDVAAGLCLVKASGGTYTLNLSDRPNFVTVFASNGLIK